MSVSELPSWSVSFASILAALIVTAVLGILPVPSLDIRDRGAKAFAGALANNNAYDQIRIDVQALRDGTTPTPADHETYVAMVPSHTPAAGVIIAFVIGGIGEVPRPRVS